MTDVAQLSIQINSTDVLSANDRLDSLASSGSGAEKAMGALEAAALKVAAAFAAWEILDKIQSSIMDAARYETLGVAMNQIGRNAGYSAEQMAGFQRGLEQTGISMTESRNNLTRMSSAQLDLSKSTDLARVAQDAAVVAGINSSEAFERLVAGIVSGQPKILHTMGIFADFKGAENALAKAHNETTKELTTAEAAQARMNAVLDEGSKRAGAYEAAMGTAGKQMASMERYIQNLEVQFGETFGPALTSGVAALTDVLKDGSKALQAWKDSGEMGMTQARLKEDLQGVMGAISGTTKVIFDHRDALVILGSAMAGLKIADMIRSLQTWGAAQMQAIAMTREQMIASQVQIAVDEAGAAAKAQYAATTLMFSAAEEAATIKATQQLAAMQALAVAEAEVSTATAVANTALSAVGGVFGLITMAITAAAAAWVMFRDTTTEGAKDAQSAAQAEIEATQKKIKALQDYNLARSQGYSGADAKKSMENNDLDADPAIRALDKTFGDLQVKWGNLTGQVKEKGFWNNLVTDAMSPLVAVGDAIGKLTGAGGGKVATPQQLEIEEAMNDTLEKRKTLVTSLQTLHKLSADFQKDQVPQAGSQGNGSAGATFEFTEYGRELNRQQEALLKLTSSERDAYEMKLKLMDNGAGGDVSQAMGLFDQIEAEKKLEAENNRWNQDESARLASLGAILDAAKQAYDRVGKSVAEVTKMKLLEKGATQEEIDATLAWNEATQKSQAAIDNQKKLTDEVGKLNQKGDYETGSAHLEDLKGAGLDLDVYNQKQHALMLQSNTVWGAMGYSVENFADRGSDALASFLNGTKTGFKAMVDSLLVDMERLILKQQVVAPLLNYASGGLMSLFGGGSDLVTTTNAPSIADMPMGGGGGDLAGLSLTPLATGTDYVPQDMVALIHQGEAVVPKAYNTSKPGAGSSVQSAVTVTINNNGTTSTQSQTPSGGAQMGREMEAAITTVIVKHQRPGGLLNPV